MNHVDIVRAEHAKNPPDGTPENTLAFLLRVLHALPPEERAGLHTRPGPPAENVARYGNVWVGVSRIMYPSGGLVKVLGDVGPGPGGETPQWVDEAPIDPDRYVKVVGETPPDPPPPPPPPPPPGPNVQEALERLTAQVGELTRRVGEFEALGGRLEAQAGKLAEDVDNCVKIALDLGQAEYEVSGPTNRVLGHAHSVKLTATRKKR